ncbi:MAG: malto-oligosyltrehalose trehalohydrolase [Acidobacteria bacterium]|nr:MAG: malto-oligosyltrehalose trehalohydrolase [Acidobacteriota bacterium]
MSFPLGAAYLGDGRCHFQVWAPRAQKVELLVVGSPGRAVEMERIERGYHQVLADEVAPGTRYFYRTDGKAERPDPASRYQPEGVHGPSEVVGLSSEWSDAGWKGLDLSEYIIYEIHVGAYTDIGTLEAVIPHLDGLRTLGVTAVELMPVAQFPGSRNWGYDGVFLFAVQNSYGGPRGLKALVEACHARGLAVVLDVVYNHLGPEGNYLAEFGPYFTDRYRTPWGQAINFDGPGSDEVRRFFIENALYWTKEFRIDALRLDAVHAIVDPSARPILEELGMAVHRQALELKRRIYVIAESDRNDSRVIRRREAGGYGLDAQWSDDFHHALHTLLTPERNGYYKDFGRVEQLAVAYREGFVFSGQYSTYRGRRHGNSSRELPPEKFVVFAQNHDQVGNRLLGERLSQIVSFEALKVAAGALLLSPFTPLLFMGEEYGETAPFRYFVSHSDPELIEVVRKGRQKEFSAFNWAGEIPDPQSTETFQGCKLNHHLKEEGHHQVLYNFVREVIRLRRQLPDLPRNCQDAIETVAFESEKLLWLRRCGSGGQVIIIINFGNRPTTAVFPFPKAHFRRILDSADQRWSGSGCLCPELLETDGNLSLSLAASSIVLFQSN